MQVYYFPGDSFIPVYYWPPGSEYRYNITGGGGGGGAERGGQSIPLCRY